nr:hypothetical protein [Pirellula sp.]
TIGYSWHYSRLQFIIKESSVSLQKRETKIRSWVPGLAKLRRAYTMAACSESAAKLARSIEE